MLTPTDGTPRPPTWLSAFLAAVPLTAAVAVYQHHWLTQPVMAVLEEKAGPDPFSPFISFIYKSVTAGLVIGSWVTVSLVTSAMLRALGSPRPPGPIFSAVAAGLLPLCAALWAATRFIVIPEVLPALVAAARSLPAYRIHEAYEIVKATADMAEMPYLLMVAGFGLGVTTVVVVLTTCLRVRWDRATIAVSSAPAVYVVVGILSGRRSAMGPFEPFDPLWLVVLLPPVVGAIVGLLAGRHHLRRHSRRTRREAGRGDA